MNVAVRDLTAFLACNQYWKRILELFDGMFHTEISARNLCYAVLLNRALVFRLYCKHSSSFLEDLLLEQRYVQCMCI